MLVATGVAQDLREAHRRTNRQDELFVAECLQENADDGRHVAGEAAQRQRPQKEHESHVNLAGDQHPRTRLSMMFLAQAYQMQDKYADAAKLIDACPGTRFVLDHCGNARVQQKDQARWRRGVAAVARRKNVVCKVSGLINTAPKGAWGPDDLAPIVNHVLDTFGPDRVMFAGDWPVCTLGGTLADWVNALKTVVRSRPSADQRKLFHDNAIKVYALK